MLTDLIREFCKENDFKIYEDYSGRMMFGRKTIGIILKPEQNLFDVLAQLTRYLESKNFDDPHLELEGVSIDELGLDAILYFPAIRSYQPPQP